MDGWVKIHRQIEESPFWLCEPFSRGQAWIDLILLANHESGIIYVRDHKITINRGQVGWSEKKLSERWKWSRTKVRKFLKDLEKEQQILQQKNNSYSIITLINYETYQHKEQQEDNRKTTERQQEDTNKNDKNDKNNNYNQFIKIFRDITGKSKARGNAKSERQFNARIKDGYSLEDIKQAIINCKNDRYHIENPHYLTTEFITRPDKLEKYLLKQDYPKPRKLVI